MTPLAATEAERLTTEQCDEFRRHPGTFNQMVQAIYDAGRARALQQTAEPVAYSANAADWPADFAQENGKYENRCSRCGIGFMGNKHRRVCRVCAAPDRAPSTAYADCCDTPHLCSAVRRCTAKDGAPSTDSAADARDAERYRWLRDNGLLGVDGYEDDVLLVYKGFGECSLLPRELDTAIDAAIAASLPQTKEE